MLRDWFGERRRKNVSYAGRRSENGVKIESMLANRLLNCLNCC